MYIGKKLREYRKSMGMTLVELSEKSGVQVATISRIENMKMTGTLESHMAIANALDMDITELYSDTNGNRRVVELNNSYNPEEIFLHTDKISHEVLAPNVPKKRMLPSLISLEQGGITQVKKSLKTSEIFIYGLAGKVEVHIGKESYLLSKGNSIYFRGMHPYQVKNINKNVARILSIICH